MANNERRRGYITHSAKRKKIKRLKKSKKDAVFSIVSTDPMTSVRIDLLTTRVYR